MLMRFWKKESIKHMTKSKLILGENGEDTRLIQGSTIGNTLQRLNKVACEKRTLAPITEFADDDWRMAWLVTLIEEKLKDRARQGHHELKLDFLGQIFPYLGRDTDIERNYDLEDPQFIKNANKALDDGMMIRTFLNNRIRNLATRIDLEKNIIEYDVLGSRIFLIPKYKQKAIESYLRLRLLINTLSPEQTVDLKRYLCFKLQPVLLSCEVRTQPISADGFGHIDSVKMDLAITFAW